MDLRVWLLQKKKALAGGLSFFIFHSLLVHGGLADYGQRVLDIPGVVHATYADLLSGALAAGIVYAAKNLPDFKLTFPAGVGVNALPPPLSHEEAAKVQAQDVALPGTSHGTVGRRPEPKPATKPRPKRKPAAKKSAAAKRSPRKR